MTRSLLIIVAICMLFSCKKKSTDPAPQKPTENTTINQLPKMIISISSMISENNVTNFSYYPNNLVKTIVKYDLLFLPKIIDSTTFSYNANNQVVNKKQYSNNTLIEDTYITYTASEKIDHVKIQSTMWLAEYTYHYNNTTDALDYILTYQNFVSQAQDSVVVNGNLFSRYTYLTANNPSNPSGFILAGTETHYASPNGVHRHIPTCLNLSIDFQSELADSFLEMGETGYPNQNYFNIASPRKYCSSVYGSFFTYTFDANNRLTNILEEISNSVTPSSGLSLATTNTIIYY